MWLSTIEQMRQLPDADKAQLDSIEQHISQGITLPFISIPSPRSYKNTPLVDIHAAAVKARLDEYMSFGAVVEMPPDYSPTHGIQPLHVVIKENKKPRIVIDLSRNLNEHLQPFPFHYASVDDAVALSEPRSWYCKVDITNCFLSFPLHHEVRPYFTFRFQGKLFQFTRMPFGLATAPFYCTQLLSVVAHALRTGGSMKLIRYIDDFLFVNESAAASQSSLQQARLIFASFGLVLNEAKTEGPAQVITFLGIEINSANQTLCCTPERIQELLAALLDTRSAGVVKRRRMESLIGKLSFAAKVLPGARPFLRRLRDSIARASSPNSPVRVSLSVQADIDMWLSHLRDWNGREQWITPFDHAVHIASDASLQGFGFHLLRLPGPEILDTTAWPPGQLLGSGFSGLYDQAHAHLHDTHCKIGWCELLAVYAAAVTYFPYLRNQCVVFRVDNQGDTYVINKQSTRSPALSGVLRALYRLALTYNVRIIAKHIPGKDNELADFLSRPEHHQHNYLARWPVVLTHPRHVSMLSSVSVLSSLLFVDSESTPQSPSS